jgi:hypothetical protein
MYISLYTCRSGGRGDHYVQMMTVTIENDYTDRFNMSNQMRSEFCTPTILAKL